MATHYFEVNQDQQGVYQLQGELSIHELERLKAFLEGSDGVFIGGCWPGDCHYINGNMKARRRVALLHEVLGRFGIETDRLWLRWVAASEGNMFAQTVDEMTARLVELGPCVMKEKRVA